MQRKILALLAVTLCMTACNKQNQATMDKKHAYTNQLIHETSPYLLQHAHNPVNWHPWKEETLELARKENKLLLISVGYAACHWCHVMERESFEDPDVAEIMNAHFINVKVDREERPDVDQVYMNAVQLLTGRGGWPLNCVALPDGRPIWGGTYFPKANWINALQQLAALYREEPEKTEEYAEKLTQGIHQSGLVTFNQDAPSFTLGELELSIRNWSPGMDLKNGGRKGAPKFMMPVNLAFLMRYGFQSGDKGILDYVNTSLTKMALGGVFDQIGGGFARYSVDDHWHIPHFEKMLYDNAQLVSLYAEAYQLTGDPLYRQVVYETTAFVERELYNGNGAFYSSLDADSENLAGELEEGAFYVWTEEELRTLLTDEFDLFAKYYNINSYGRWEEDRYHLIRSLTDPTFCDENQISEEHLTEKTTAWKKLLLETREKRIRPRLDDKTLTSWNALMLKGYVDAYRVFLDVDLLKMALRNAHFIQNHMVQEDGGLYRNHKGGKSNISAYLEDYATVIEAYISLYEATLDENWLLSAKQFADYCFDHFYDERSRMFFFTSDKDAGLITRKVETEDNVIPSSNSIMAKNLFLLGHYFENSHYRLAAEIMLNNVKSNALSYGGGYANWLDLYANYIGDFYEIAIVGKDAGKKLREFQGHYLPNSLLAGSTGESGLPLLQYKYSDKETTIYVCIDGACKLPVQAAPEALKQVRTSFE